MKKHKSLRIILTLLLATTSITTTLAQGFIHADGKNIVDGDGNNFLLKGMGIGGWMVKEPYMFNIYEEDDEGQHKIHNDIIQLVGTDNFNTFNEAWKANFFNENDVKELKKIGFNSIRIPMHYNLFTLPIEEEPLIGKDTWLTEGFERMDSVLAWGERHNIYIILDMHAAPGGQGVNGNINDFDPKKDSFWENNENKRKFLSLWAKLAERYSENPWIAVYDPMNEPNWSFEYAARDTTLEKWQRAGCGDNTNTPLRNLYKELIDTIRYYDKNHLIAIEGNCWGGNHNGLWPLPVEDKNVCLSFHKYWNPNKLSEIQSYLDLRNQHNVPLWMSESGENSNNWYKDAVELLESQNIGWCWWTWKKSNNRTGGFKINEPDGWQGILDYWNPNKAKTQPDTASVFKALMALTENIKLENSNRNHHALASLIPCSERGYLPIPDTVLAEDACNATGAYTGWCWDNDKNKGCGQLIGNIENFARIYYNINVPKSFLYSLTLRLAGYGGGLIEVYNEDETVKLATFSTPDTDDWFKWQNVTQVIELEEGNQTLVLKVVSTGKGLNFDMLNIEENGPIGLKNDKRTVSYQVFPNPGNGIYTVQGDEINFINLLNFQGENLLQKNTNTPNNKILLDLTDYQEGAYLLNIIDKQNNMHSIKIIHTN